MSNAKGQLLTAWFAPVLIAVLLVAAAAQAATASAAYPETRKVLEELMIAGQSAAAHYRLSARQARSENLPYIADLFKAMAVSQLVMLRNFERLLSELDRPVSTCALTRIHRGTTRQNLLTAIQNEIHETDERYPRALERIRDEGHTAAMASLRQAIQAQALHRRDMRDIQRGARHFFGLLKREVQRRATTYYICQHSGALLLNALPAVCPVRGASTASYRVLHSVSLNNDLSACQPGAATTRPL